MTEFKDIPASELHVDPVNVRPGPAISPKLIDSIKDEGVLEPLVVRPHDGEYGVILGSRRFVAAKSAGLDEVPCIIREDLEGDDEKAEDLSFKENEHREGLPTWKVKELVNDRYEETDGRKLRGKRIKEVADRLNISHQTVREYLDISEKLDSTINIRLKEPSERTEEERKQLETTVSETPQLAGDKAEAEGFDLEKERAEGFPSLEKVPEKVARILSKSDFFQELQEDNPAKAHKLATEAAKAGQHKAPEVIREYKREAKEAERKKKLPSGPKPKRLTVRVGKNLVEYLDRYVEERDYIGNRAHAMRVIARKRLLELYEEGN